MSKQYYSYGPEGHLQVDPVYATSHHGWLALLRAAEEIAKVCRIARTPYGAVTPKDEEFWRNHPLVKVAMEPPDGTGQLEKVARWLTRQAELFAQEEDEGEVRHGG